MRSSAPAGSWALARRRQALSARDLSQPAVVYVERGRTRASEHGAHTELVLNCELVISVNRMTYDMSCDRRTRAGRYFELR